MKQLLQKLPLPVSGLMLGLVALGNLFGPYSGSLRYLLGSLSAMIFIALVFKIVVYPQSLKEGFSNPVIACIMATFPMGMMLLSTYIHPFVPSLALGVWVLAIGLYTFLIVLFTLKHLLPIKAQKAIPGYFVMYVGIVVASVTAPLYGLHLIGQVIFWIGLIFYVPLFGLVSYRMLKYDRLPEPAQSIVVIYAAPASLLLAGYLNSVPEKNTILVLVLGAWAFLMTLFGVSQMPKLLKLPFYPSCSAFTFPFVISAIAFNGLLRFLTGVGFQMLALNWIGNLQVAWAALMVAVVFTRYALYLSPSPQKASTKVE